MRAGRFRGLVPEEWREYKAVTLGLCAAPNYGAMPYQQLDLWFAFRALEDRQEREDAERAEAAQRR